MSGEAIKALRSAARRFSVTMTAILERFLRDPDALHDIAKKAQDE